MCISPIVVKRKYDSMKGEKTMRVPCGKCVQCLRRRANGWTFRLLEESKVSTSCAFITLTYEDTPTSENGFPTLHKPDLQKFFKRLRKRISDNHLSYGYTYKKDIPTIKYYACGEYGSKTYRPHYHAIVYNLPYMLFTEDFISSCWGLGHVQIDQGNELTMRYCSKYVMKSHWNKDLTLVDCSTGELFEDDRIPEFSLMSKKLGFAFLTPAMKKYLRERCQGFVMLSGNPTALPRYYKDQLFDTTDLTEGLANERWRNSLNEAAELAREFDYKTLFDNNPHRQNEWKKDQIRRFEKTLVLERQSI